MQEVSIVREMSVAFCVGKEREIATFVERKVTIRGAKGGHGRIGGS
jgi:hypothetical protein